MRYAKINPWAKAPTRKFKKDAGIDFYYCADSIDIEGDIALTALVIPPYSVAKVHTGIAVEIPDGYVGIIKPKSRSDFLVGAGVIDAGYQGEIIVKVFNTSSGNIVFTDGDPVAQMLVVPVVTGSLDEISYEELTKVETERGNSGGIHKFDSSFQFLNDDESSEIDDVDFS